MQKYLVYFLFLLSTFGPIKLHAQGFSLLSEFLSNEEILDVDIIPQKGTRYAHGLVRSEKAVGFLYMPPDRHHFYSNIYTAPPEVKITSATFKSNDDNIAIILLSNGIIKLFSLNHQSEIWEEIDSIEPNVNFVSSQILIGDALYILKQGIVYASWDTAKTWSIDTINIGREYVADISVDTNHYGWVITQSKNLYSQHPDSNIWRKNTAFSTTGFPQKIHIDKKGRMFISTTVSANRVMVSTNGGASWSAVSTGLTEAVASFGEDIFGNIYVIGTGSQAFRLSNLTPPWIPISDSLKSQAFLPSNSKIINKIEGDSILYASTKYGMFESADLGENWKPSPAAMQMPSHHIYSKVIHAGKYYFVSTNFGIMRCIVGDTLWEKIYPKNGFIFGINAISSDSAGTIYVNVPFKTGVSSSYFYTASSPDFGATWNLDTAGHKALGLTSGTQFYDHWVDRQGTQYLAGNGILFSKKPGGIWKRDTAGLGIKSGEFVADVSLNNKKGITYIARRTGTFPTYTLAVYQRSVGDSVWNIMNTSALATSEGRLVSDPDGNIIVRTLSGSYKFWKYDGSNWTQIPLPTGLGSNPFAQMHAVDRSGVLWAVFFGGGINQGVYFTTNGGAQWKHAGLKGVGINFLSTVGDTAYAVTIIDGVHGFTTASIPTSVQTQSGILPSAFELNQNYPNPFNPSTSISFSLPKRSMVSLTVFDILGREVTMLLNEERTAGFHSIPFNASTLSSGVYIYTLKSGNYTASKKLLLMK